jgi:hypothetical protein
MCITFRSTFLSHDRPDASLAFDRNRGGVEVRDDVGTGPMRGIAVGRSDQGRACVVVQRPEQRPHGPESGPRDQSGNYIDLTRSAAPAA